VASFVNIRLGWNWLTEKNILAYNITALITTVKIFIVQTTDPLRYISKDFLVSVEKKVFYYQFGNYGIFLSLLGQMLYNFCGRNLPMFMISYSVLP
jgi:hypothetical protein